MKSRAGWSGDPLMFPGPQSTLDNWSPQQWVHHYLVHHWFVSHLILTAAWWTTIRAANKKAVLSPKRQRAPSWILVVCFHIYFSHLQIRPATSISTPTPPPLLVSMSTLVNMLNPGSAEDVVVVIVVPFFGFTSVIIIKSGSNILTRNPVALIC